MSNLVRDSCDPGLLESYGVGKGQRAIANAIHDVTIPAKRWGQPEEAISTQVQILFSDAQTHFANYSHNILYEINACSDGNGAMVKNWQEVFEQLSSMVPPFPLPNLDRTIKYINKARY